MVPDGFMMPLSTLTKEGSLEEFKKKRKNLLKNRLKSLIASCIIDVSHFARELILSEARCQNLLKKLFTAFVWSLFFEKIKKLYFAIKL